MSASTSTLVVIEDDPQIRRFLRTGLSAEPFRIFEAETGRAGLVEAATRKPDLVILDLGLPDLDGVEVVAELRLWYTRPIIILSARSNEQEKIKALAALVRHAGKVCTHRQLLAEVWGPSHVEHGHYLRIYMAQLRHKLETDSTNPRFLRTEAGVGYRLLID